MSGSISITVNMRQLTIDLDYIFKDQPKKYTIHLDAMAANTQYGGKIYHFICPLTSMRSKKLFLIDGVFCHRFSNPRSMYANQIIPKEWRESCKSIQRDALSAAINERINDPRSKKYYQGRETKWFKRAKKLLIKCYN